MFELYCEPEISLPSTAVSMLALLRTYKWLVRDPTVNNNFSDQVKDFLDKADGKLTVINGAK